MHALRGGIVHVVHRLVPRVAVSGAVRVVVGKVVRAARVVGVFVEQVVWIKRSCTPNSSVPIERRKRDDKVRTFAFVGHDTPLA